ncbi:hypothetical protein K440DRAFT_632778 [Wilcoxina mikolae CBS 423.85]|nr:hypothetical protein K440DRAFT_632778 [Wilcoxina mikolae CBS 423.85]
MDFCITYLVVPILPATAPRKRRFPFAPQETINSHPLSPPHNTASRAYASIKEPRYSAMAISISVSLPSLYVVLQAAHSRHQCRKKAIHTADCPREESYLRGILELVYERCLEGLFDVVLPVKSLH